jgi:hypothetical protein
VRRDALLPQPEQFTNWKDWAAALTVVLQEPAEESETGSSGGVDGLPAGGDPGEFLGRDLSNNPVWQAITKATVGLSQADNTRDVDKPVSHLMQNALNTKADLDTTSLALAARALVTLQLLAGAGLIGGGDLSADVTFAVGQGTGIVVNADDVALDTAYLAEAIDDRVSVLLQNGTGISWSYNDTAGTLTPTVTLAPFSTADLAEGTRLYYTDERVDDRVTALLQNGTGISWTYNDASGTLTPAVSLASFSTTNLAEGTNLYFTDERVDDRVSVLLQNGTGISWSYNDPAGTLTPTVTLAPFSTTNLAEGTNLYYTDERVDDRVAALLQNGTGISWSYNDTAGTLTPTVTLGAFSTSNLAEGINLYYTDERVDDRVAALIQNGTGITWTYNDAAGTLTATISLAAFSTSNLAEGTNLYYTDERVDDRVAALLLLASGAPLQLTYNDAGGTLTINGAATFVLTATNDNKRHALGTAISATQVDVIIPLPWMASAPTASTLSGTIGHFALLDAGGTIRAATAQAFISATKFAVTVRFTATSAAFTIGQAIPLINNSGTGATTLTIS